MAAGSACANPALVADLNRDMVVDMYDWAAFSSQWLKDCCWFNEWCNWSDFDRDTTVQLEDYARLASMWLRHASYYLEVYSDGWGTLLDTMGALDEGEITFTLIDDNPYGGPQNAEYYIYARSPGRYTEIYSARFERVFVHPFTNHQYYSGSILLDLDPIMPGKCNGVILLTQYFFRDNYVSDTVVTVRDETDAVVVQFTTDAQGRFAVDLDPGNYYFEFTADYEDDYREEVEITGQYNDVYIIDHAQMFKPNVYLYPQTELALEVRLRFPYGGEILASEPAYEDGWRVMVEPSGLIDGEHEFLFYESSQPNRCQTACGWVVARDALESFFRQNLEATGFIEKEINDFIAYWIPRFDACPYYAIYPQYNGELDEMVMLDFSVPPDNLIRVSYLVRGLSTDALVLEEPTIPPFDRGGFTAAEWGVIIVPQPDRSYKQYEGVLRGLN